MDQSRSEWIYNHLEDEESRFVFSNIQKYHKNKDNKYIKEIVQRYIPELADNLYWSGKEMNLIDELKKKARPAVVYGCGMYGKRAFEFLQKNGVEVYAFVDSDEKKWNTNYEGVKIISLNELYKMTDKENYSLVVSPKYQYADIVRNLVNYGISKDDIWVYRDYIGTTLENQYFDKNIIKTQEDEVFIDGGSLDLRTSREFVKFCGADKVKKVYAFEPDSSNYQRAQEKLQNSEKTELINAGLWSKETWLSFESLGNGSSRIVESENGETGLVKVVALDETVDERVTFIKMDIEGSELEALKGAKKIIMRDHPKLAICVYHKEDDIVEIPEYVLKLVPEYKIYMRHYSNYECETVMYAVAD